MREYKFRGKRMRLSMEEVQKQHESTKKLYEQGLTVAPVDVKRVLDLYDTIEALQQENEQLRAQVAQVRVALTIANNYMPDIGQVCVYGKCKGCGTNIGYSRYKYCLKCARAIIDEVLSGTPADYLNPADAELLRKARKVLHKGISELRAHCKYFYQTPEEDACIEMHEAVVEIDKVIGGKEDGK